MVLPVHAAGMGTGNRKGRFDGTGGSGGWWESSWVSSLVFPFLCLI